VQPLDAGAKCATFASSAEASNELHWMLTVTQPECKPDLEDSKVESRPEPVKGASFSFFDLHAALASCCTSKITKDEAMVHVPVLPALLGGKNKLQVMMSEKRKNIEAITERYPKPEDGQHPYFALNASERISAGATLFRSSSADIVSSPWTDLGDLDKAEFFWAAYTKLDDFYALAEDWLVEMETTIVDGKKRFLKRGKVRFLSQAWHVPPQWEELMGEGSYAEAKAAEICCVAKDIAARELGSTTRWREVQFWVDKCCIPQGDRELCSWCVNLLEEYIVFCDGLVVLTTWTYFTRLWCVYEWACFLLVHDPMNIEICADPFVRGSTLPLYLDAIGNFKLSSCQCYREEDRQILHDKVSTYYKSTELFEKFLKFTAIALFARCTAQRRSAKAVSALAPWQQLAERQGFPGLAGQISEMMGLLPVWRESAVASATGGGTSDVQSAVLHQVETWFEEQMVPLILLMRKEAASEEGLKNIQDLREAASEVTVLDFEYGACLHEEVI
ncbi:unnamed protein product, partial [Symbiodinium pilosum]